jgi:hypothetical protein
MGRARILRGATLATAAFAVIWAFRPGIAWADSEGGPPLVPGSLSWSAPNVAFYATLFGVTAVLAALGLFMLWGITRRARAADASEDIWMDNGD